MPRQNYKIPIPIPEKEREREKKRKESQMLYWTSLSLFPWAKICLCLLSHHTPPYIFHFIFHCLLACHYDLESFLFHFPSLFLSHLPFYRSYQTSLSVSFSVFYHDQQSKRIPIQKIKLSVQPLYFSPFFTSPK